MDKMDEFLRYFQEDVAHLYEDEIKENAQKGLHDAITDALGNDSPYTDDNGKYISWVDILEDNDAIRF